MQIRSHICKTHSLSLLLELAEGVAATREYCLKTIRLTNVRRRDDDGVGREAPVELDAGQES